VRFDLVLSSARARGDGLLQSGVRYGRRTVDEILRIVQDALFA
jgi:hypothetical protein